MKFSCEQCYAKYSIADERVRGKILRIRCKKCGNIVTKDDLVKGYQYAPDQYAIIEPDDISKIKLKTTKVIDIVGFVEASEISPMLYDAPYFAGPDGDVVTLDPSTARAARERPCRERVADRAVPAGILMTVATVLGASAFLVELIVVRPRARKAARAPVDPPPPST